MKKQKVCDLNVKVIYELDIKVQYCDGLDHVDIGAMTKFFCFVFFF